MARHALIRALMIGFLFGIGIDRGFAAEPVMSDYKSFPIFLGETVTPNVMILLDNSGSMNFNAYGSAGPWAGEDVKADFIDTAGFTYIGWIVTEPFAGSPYSSLDIHISNADDDAQEIAGTGVVATAGSYLDLGRDSTGNDTIAGLRFKNVQIPQGATVTNAYIRFTTGYVYASYDQGTMELTVQGEDINDADIFESADNNISSRTQTTASVSWTLNPGTEPWDAPGATHDTPDLTPIVQEIVNRDGWSNGSPMAFTFTKADSTTKPGRLAIPYDQGASGAPLLHVEVQRDQATEYYGYFNPDYFYEYNTGTNQFELKYEKVEYTGDPAGSGYWKVKKLNGDPYNLYEADIAPASPARGSGYWDGNWLNWMAMRRIDVLRKVLMGGKATSRTGGGDQINEGEDNARYVFIKQFDSTGGACATPYNGNFYYAVKGNDIYVLDGSSLTLNTDLSGTVQGSPPALAHSFKIRVKKNVTYEPDDFYNYCDAGCGENLAGVLQKIDGKVDMGNMFFRLGTGVNESGAEFSLNPPLGSNNSAALVSAIQGKTCDTWTPLAESYYTAVQYFKQETPAAGLDYNLAGFPNTTDAQDPYYKDTQYVPCTKSYVILLTDGASTKDQQIPAALKDFDADGNDGALLNCDGTDYLDDVALYAHTTDLRSATVGKNDLEGDQNVALYTIYAFGDDDDARQLLKDAARNGGFEDKNGNLQPDGDYGDPAADRLEWDEDGDGNPDTYFEAANGYRLEQALINAVEDILKKSASGTAVSIISSATEGEGNLIQAYFRPVVPSGLDEVKWIGSMHSVWIDPQGNMREDTNLNSKLDLNTDRILEYYDAGGDVMVNRYDVSSNAYPDLSSATPADTVGLMDISAIWEAGSVLAGTDPADRNIFTYIDMDKDQAIDETTDDPLDDQGEVVRFQTDVAAIKPYLGVADDAAWSELGATHDNRFENIINFVRGVNTGFSGSADIRDREINGQTWKLGDIVHSTPVLVTTPFDNYDILYGDSSYYTFYSAIKDRETMVYVGANDGMLHAFTSWRYDTANAEYDKPAAAGAGEVIGRELWAYIPQSLLPHLKWLPDQNYSHVYYADLKPKIFDAKILADDAHYTDPDADDNWGTILLMGLNFGGRHIWAAGDYDDGAGGVATETRHFFPTYTCMDITDPRNPRLLWERSYDIPAAPGENAGNETELGLTTSYPAILKVNDKWFAVFGSGPAEFDGTKTGKGHIYVVDLKTGEPYQNQVSFKDWLFEAGEDRAFMADAVTLDKNLNYTVDAAYIGETYDDDAGTGVDWKGKLYRVRVPFKCSGATCNYGDLDNGYYVDDPIDLASPWTVSKLFDSPAPFTSSPSLSVDARDNTWVFAGTGRYLSEDDKTSTDQQYIFGIKDPFFNPEHGSGAGLIFGGDGYYQNGGSSLELTTADLFDADNYTVLTNGIVYDEDTSSYIGTTDTLINNVLNKDGWSRSLDMSGERVITKPAIIGGSLLTTSFIPNSDICGYGGASNLYAFYYETGTAFEEGVFEPGGVDVTILGEIKEVAIEKVDLGDGLASAPGIHVGKQKGGKVTAFIQTSKGDIKTEMVTPAINPRSGLKAWKERE